MRGEDGWRLLGALMGGLFALAAIPQLRFSEEAAIERARQQVRDASGGAWRLQAADASSGLFGGVVLRDLALYPNSSWGALAGPTLRVETLAIRRPLLAWASDQRVARFAADLYDGALRGELALGESEAALAFAAEDLDLSQVPLPGRAGALRAAGRLSLDADLAINAGDMRQSAGHLRLGIDGLALQVSDLRGLSLRDRVAFREASLEMEVRSGKLEVTRGVFASDAATVTLDGHLALAPALHRTRLSLTVTVDLSAELDALLVELPALQPFRDGEGRYLFALSGAALSPSFREQRPGIEEQLRAEGAALTPEARERRRAERLEQLRARTRPALIAEDAPPQRPR